MANPARISDVSPFEALRKKARLRLLRMHYESKVGHIGGNLSALDAMLFLHHNLMDKEDRFVLSKGHAAGALYVTLWTLGKIPESELNGFHKDNTLLAGHPPAHGIEGISFATGSLGHGVGLAAGMALGRTLDGKPGHVYCLTSDGEWQEGSNWESLIFLNHHQLSNLTLLVDCNGLQGFGSTQDVASMSIDRLAKAFGAFDVECGIIDGHGDIPPKKSDLPRILLMRTHKGNGVSFMQDRMEWHYKPLTEELYRQAVREVEAS